MFYEIENLILGNIVQDPKKYFEHSQMFNPLMFEQNYRTKEKYQHTFSKLMFYTYHDAKRVPSRVTRTL